MFACKEFSKKCSLPLSLFLFCFSLKAAGLGNSSILEDATVAPAILDLIDHSQKQILIHLLAIDCDHSTEPIIESLIRKAGEGVEVKLIINRGYSYIAHYCLMRLNEAGIQVTPSVTHSSYWLNEQNEILFGSENLVRMNLADKIDSDVDRDLMLHLKGDIGDDLRSDFFTTWASSHQEKISVLSSKRTPCRLLVEDSLRGQHEISQFLIQQVTAAKKVFFTGVRVEVSDSGGLGSKIIEALKSKPDFVTFLGNGPTGGNGELSKLGREWVSSLNASGNTWLGSILKMVLDWDSERVWNLNKIANRKLMQDSKIKIFQYPKFLHYKVWSFDESSFLITSANLNEEAFEKFHETAIYCKDDPVVELWKRIETKDLQTSQEFLAK